MLRWFPRPNQGDTIADVVDAARTVVAHEFIMHLPDGYQTHLGEREGTLSQGQRQLLALTRAILADPRILILDEATANIDSRTARTVQQAREKLLRGRTSLVIARRLSTVRNADKVRVLHASRIIEQGTHTELLGAGGICAQWHGHQFLDRASVAAA